MSATAGRRRLLRLVSGVLAGGLTGCSPEPVEPLVGNTAVFSKGSLQLLVLELVRGRRLALSLVNTGDEVFVVYVTSSAGPSWHATFENGALLTYAPADPEPIGPRGVTMSHHPNPIAKEHQLVRGSSWGCIVDLERALHPPPSGIEASRMPREVAKLRIQIVAPPELAVGDSGQRHGEPYDPRHKISGHFRVGRSQWAHYAIGGEIRLSRPVRPAPKSLAPDR